MSRGSATKQLTIEQLSELVDAIDRRLPHVARIGEVAIANAAAELRAEAVRRIAELEAELTSRPEAGP